MEQTASFMLAKLRGTPILVRVVVVIGALLSAPYGTAKWLLDYASRYKEGAAFIAAVTKEHGVAQQVERLLAATPGWVPAIGLASCAVFILAYMLVPETWWRKTGAPVAATVPPAGDERGASKTTLDPLATYFKGHKIKVADFIAEGGVPLISGKTFDDCTIYGPAILNRDNRSPLLEACTYAEPSFFVEVQPDAPLVGAIRVEGCVFRRCHFVGVGLAALRHEMQGATPPAVSDPMIRGWVERFEMLDARDLTEQEAEELWDEIGREFSAGEILAYGLGNVPRLWFRAWVKIETVGTPSKATAWRFSVRFRDGREAPCLPVKKPWKPPASWPKIAYSTVDEIESMYLQNHCLYNVYTHVVSSGSDKTLDMESFEAHFNDDKGTTVVCTVKK